MDVWGRRLTPRCRIMLGFAVVLYISAWILAGTSEPATPVALPTFDAAPATRDAAPSARTTALPTDCAETITGPVDITALLGRPIGSVAAQSITGIPSESVGLTERLTCRYRDSRGTGPTTLLQMTAAAFTDPAAAEQQRRRNVAAEQADALTVTDVPLGAARATLLTGREHAVLMVAHDRYTLSATLPHGVFPADQEQEVLTDLACRVLPALAPPSATPPEHAAVAASSP
jgi:hypothetical protein